MWGILGRNHMIFHGEQGGGEGRDKLSPNEYRGVTYENWLL